MSGKKILILFLALSVVVLMLSSFSFALNISKPEVAHASFAPAVSKDTTVKDIVNTTLEAKIEPLPFYMEKDIEKNIEKTAVEIHKIKEETKIRAASNTTDTINNAVSLPAENVNLSDIEGQIFNLINSIRASHGLSQLAPNQMLVDLARLRSSDMVQRGYFSHYTPDGKNIKHIFAQYGVTYSNFGENLGNATPASYGTPGAFMDAWMKSPSHRDNMLKGFYSLAGVGVVDGGGRRVVTVLFIR
jgi:uncharacterized protein YkwD